MLPNFELWSVVMALTDQIRQAIEDSGLTRYRISKETGVSQSILTRFVVEVQGVSSTTLDALAEFLGLEVVRRDEEVDS